MIKFIRNLFKRPIASIKVDIYPQTRDGYETNIKLSSKEHANKILALMIHQSSNQKMFEMFVNTLVTSIQQGKEKESLRASAILDYVTEMAVNEVNEIAEEIEEAKEQQSLAGSGQPIILPSQVYSKADL